MTTLQSNALGRLPLLVEEVERIYGVVNPGRGISRSLRNVCESHERLRAEVVGLEIMNADAPNTEADAFKDKSDYAEDGACTKCKWGGPGTGHTSGYHKNDCAVLKKERDLYTHFQGAERRNSMPPMTLEEYQAMAGGYRQ